MCSIPAKNHKNTDMHRVTGAEPRFLRIAHKVKGQYAIAFDIGPGESGFSFMEEVFDHLPTTDEIRAVINAYYNAETDAAILSGFRFNDIPVWLSSENQFNFKAAFDLAVQTEGKTLPVKFKLGTDAEPVYYEFTTVEELTEFYTGAIAYIQKCLEDGWKKKDAVDYSVYTLNDGEGER